MFKKKRENAQHISEDHFDPNLQGDIAYLTTVQGSIAAESVRAMLRSFGIPSLCKFKGTGEMLVIYAGMTLLEADIYVPQNALEQARQLLENQPPLEEEEE